MIRRLHTVSDAQVQALARLVIDCVDGGASIGFMAPLDEATALAFWRRIAGDVARGARVLLVAETADGIAGTVQLVLELPDNQPHRADLAKMMVDPAARRQGLGEALLLAAEAVARECGKSLLVLDAVSGGDAERLYASRGWQKVGSVPGFALMPYGGFCDTTYYYRELVA